MKKTLEVIRDEELRGILAFPFGEQERYMAEIQDIAITWWGSPPEVCVIQDRKKQFLSCPVRIVLFDALACLEGDGRVAGVVVTGGGTEEAKEFEERIRNEYKDV